MIEQMQNLILSINLITQQNSITNKILIYFQQNQDGAFIAQLRRKQVQQREKQASGKINKKNPNIYFVKESRQNQPFCLICNRAFSQNNSLYSHMRNMHGIQPIHINKDKNYQESQIYQESQDGSGGKQTLKNFSKEDLNSYAETFAFDDVVRKPDGTTLPIMKIYGQKQKKQVQSLMKKTKIQDTQQNNNFNENVKKINCIVCQKKYWSQSALNYHLRKKHSTQEYKTACQKSSVSLSMNIYECQYCGVCYQTKVSLKIHQLAKHVQKLTEVEIHTILVDEDLSRCGCGLIYQTSSSLYSHIKKKHDGIQPQGTIRYRATKIEALQEAKKNEANAPVPFEQESLDYYFRNFKSPSECKQSDSHSQQNSKKTIKFHQLSQVSDKSNLKRQFVRMDKKAVITFGEKQQKAKIEDGIERRFKCGCGKAYSCSSSLYLHIKKAHNSQIPIGTVGGIRGIKYNAISKRKPKQYKEEGLPCHQCRKLTGKSYFQCQNCQDHVICPPCYWQKPQDKEHQWITKQIITA